MRSRGTGRTAAAGPSVAQATWLDSRGVPGPFQLLGVGFRTDVHESSAGFIVRIGKSAVDGNTFSTERRLMDVVRTCVDIEIPRPTLAEDSLAAFPYGVMVYPKLAGSPPTAPSGVLARGVASALRQLHAMATATPAPAQVVDGNALAALVRSTRPYLTEAQRRETGQWQVDQRNFLAAKPTRCMIHGDFWHANWLCTKDGRTITGLLDFERCGIGLPHQDLAPLRYLGEAFRAAALDAYCEGTTRDPASLLQEVRMFDALRELQGLDWALRNPDANEVDDAVEKVAEALANYH
ncbi:MAG: aminoglycoside phosphotransferase family protein [Gammaproteobacteria bacterium]|nr:aminoglycoside phosphotransferase family protein [Gammaproteobacteria bacterium]